MVTPVLDTFSIETLLNDAATSSSRLTLITSLCPLYDLCKQTRPNRTHPSIVGWVRLQRLLNSARRNRHKVAKRGRKRDAVSSCSVRPDIHSMAHCVASQRLREPINRFVVDAVHEVPLGPIYLQSGPSHTLAFKTANQCKLHTACARIT